MIIDQNRHTNTFSFRGLLASDVVALQKALEHEVIRSAARVEDERLGDTAREEEKKKGVTMKRMLGHLSAQERLWANRNME